MSLQTDYLWTVRVVRLEPFVLSLPEPLRYAYHIARVESAEPFVLSLSKHSCRVSPVHIVRRAIYQELRLAEVSHQSTSKNTKRSKLTSGDRPYRQ